MKNADTFFASVVAIGGTIVTTLLGGWDKVLEILLIVIMIDYVTGFAAAIKTKSLDSRRGFEGLIKKATIFLVIILAVQLDRITGNETSLFKTAACFFFIANDGLSIVENVGEMGVPMPKFLMNVLNRLKDNNDTIEGGEDDSGKGGA